MGNIQQEYLYDSFGNIMSMSGVLDNPYTYTGREYDPESGLYYYRARYYDAKIGRFLSPDPVGFLTGDLNLYLYVRNNPINWVDPWGLCGEDNAFPDPIISPILNPALPPDVYIPDFNVIPDIRPISNPIAPGLSPEEWERFVQGPQDPGPFPSELIGLMPGPAGPGGSALLSPGGEGKMVGGIVGGGIGGYFGGVYVGTLIGGAIGLPFGPGGVATGAVIGKWVGGFGGGYIGGKIGGKVGSQIIGDPSGAGLLY